MSLARPSGNLTGVNWFPAEVAARRLEFLRELAPRADRIVVLVDPAATTTNETTLRDVETAARAMGLQIQVVSAGTGREIDSVFASIGREQPAASLLPRPLFLRIGASNWPSRRCIVQFRPPIPFVSLSTPAG